MMKLACLHRVPFGPFLVNPYEVGSIISSEHDAYGGTYNNHTYGCCITVQGVEYRVRESLNEVVEILNEAWSKPDHVALLADPVVGEISKTAYTEPAPKKGKKSGRA